MHIRTIKLTEAIECKQSSNATKLFRGTALSLKFIRDLKAARTRRREPQNTKPTLTVEEISEARSQWIRKLQEPMKHEKNFENLKQQLGLFRKEGRRSIPQSAKADWGMLHWTSQRVTLFNHQDDIM